jgi:hydrogenase maturation protease
MKTLIIGYGNNSRRDDGVGWFVIEQLGALSLPDVELRTSQQLEVELAEDLAAFTAAIFVDAAVPEAAVPVQRVVVKPRFEGHAVAHYLTPSDLLAVCKSVYGHDLPAILFTIRGRDFDFGSTLSPEVEKAARDVVGDIEELIRNGSLRADPDINAGSANTEQGKQ